MTTITLDILDDKALNLLKYLEALKIIRIQSKAETNKPLPVKLSEKYSGAMTKQAPEEINKQIDDLRDEWD